MWYYYSMKNTYERLAKASKKHGEKNDCTVKAVAVLANLPYNYAHAALAKVGRKRGKGPTWGNFFKVLRNLNLWYERVEIEGKTVRTLEKNLPKKGRYLITVRGHVLAAVDGKVHDWSSGRLHRINKVYKISF